MALANLPGAPFALLGPGFGANLDQPTNFTVAMNTVNGATICIGQICTSDGGSHTINTTGSSALAWQTAAVTFSNAATTVKIGLAAVLTTAGPPGRAVHASDVVTFDVSKSVVGGGGGITAFGWQTHVPDTGSKTIANGDLVAFCIQMTARGGTDVVNSSHGASAVAFHRPLVTKFDGSSYTVQNLTPNVIITFSDGAIGFFQGSDIASSFNSRLFNSTLATKEYGQLYDIPFPMKIHGFCTWVNPSNDLDLVLYSDPLGSPVAERTVSLDANTVAAATVRRFTVQFASPYTTTANQKIGAVFKPGAANVSIYYKTLANAAHRVTDPYGTSGYGISRATGAFANANSSLDHYYIGLVVGAFEAGGGTAGRAVQVNADSLVGA